MTVYSVLLLIGALCGIGMVLGGMILLYKGAISLSNVSGEEAFTVEFKKELRISTQYPALAIFIIGLLFVWFSVFMGKPNLNELIIKGNAVNLVEPVTISLKTTTLNSDLTHVGNIFETTYPNFKTIQIVVSAPGYKNYTRSVKINPGRTITDLGDIKLKQDLEKKDLKSKNIVSLPSDMNVPATTFGGSR